MNKKPAVRLHASLVISATLLASCSLFELSGKVTRATGDAMTEYSQEHDGTIANVAGLGGKINTAVGSTVEDAAKKGANERAGKTAQTQPADARRSTSTSNRLASAETTAPGAGKQAVHQVGVRVSDAMSVMEMQTRLTELGYKPGHADGVMNKRSLKALKRFQKDNGLPVTGGMDPETVAKLRVLKQVASAGR